MLTRILHHCFMRFHSRSVAILPLSACCHHLPSRNRTILELTFQYSYIDSVLLSPECLFHELPWFACTCFTIAMVTVFKRVIRVFRNSLCCYITTDVHTYVYVCMNHLVLCQCVRLSMNAVDCVNYHSISH